MTGPASRVEQGTGAPLRSTGTQGAVGAVLVVLALGLALRLIIAYLLPGSGFDVDRNAFQFWAHEIATNGPFGFYTRDFLHDYTPGYLYVLWLIGIVGGVLGGIGDLIKVPPILADLAIGYLVWSMIIELGGRRSVALTAAFVAVVNPISWFDSAVWAQVDSVGVVFLLLGLRDLWRDRPERAAFWAVIAALIKPQLGILIPILALVVIRRALWPVRDPDSGDVVSEGEPVTERPGLLERFRAWERRTDHPIRIVTTGVVALVTTVLLCLPFGLSVVAFQADPPYVTSGLLGQIFSTAAGYPYLTVNAYNPWALIPGDLGHSLANTGVWVCDGPWGVDTCGNGIATFGPVPAVLVGSFLMLAVTAVIALIAARRPDRLTILLCLTLLALAFCTVPTRVHERYAYPVFALAILLAGISWRWRIAYAALTATVFLNMYAVLTNPFYNNPGINDWLGIGDGLRTFEGVAILSVINGLVFLWALTELRAGARRRLAWELDDEIERAEVEDGIVAPPDVVHEPRPAPPPPPALRARPAAVGAPVAAAVAARSVPISLPSWTPRATFAELGMVGWFRSRLTDPPIRPDRSASLRGERGGRFDKLDLWFVVVLIAATMVLRTYRLDEPYKMHFDEVYHARTATEFLQDWRYGLSHNIYEWTHPHLAKYAMAVGLVLWGGDHVQSTSELGVPVTASVVEPKRVDTNKPDQRFGERLHVATGSEIRTYDLLTRDLISVVKAPGANALAIDPTGLRLIIGTTDGTLESLDLTTIGDGGVDVGVEPQPIGKVGGPLTYLLVTDDGSAVVAATAAHLSIVDLDGGQVRGTLALPGIAGLAPGGTGAAIIADVDKITDRTATASKLADLMSANAASYRATLASASPGSSVVLGPPGTGEVRKALDAAITDGSLPGIAVGDVSRIAVATAAGVAFIDPARASLITTLALAGGAHGLTLVPDIDDTPRLYVTSGGPTNPGYDILGVGGDKAKSGPVFLDGSGGVTATQSHLPLPGPSSWVTYDTAAQQVHILGLAPNVDPQTTSGANQQDISTVYVVEPHANAVYADAPLPAGFTPSAWATDVEPDYPSADRQQILVFDGAGASASIDIGSHAFAWRLPGVIAGAITAALLYLLARILFRRRLVAGLVGLFVLVDGMFFVQARIGMNDVYVGLFIVAAYTVFAAVWTGWWRGRAAFWVGMPIVGLLLGLALASKWVAAYAIGALLLLLLVRSALGRVLAILGLIGITSVLGYMAISVPEGEGFGNLTFLLIMVALTLLAVVAAVLHPVAWTDDEFRFAVLAPVGLGTLAFFVALARGSLDQAIVVGPLSVTPLLVAIGLASASLVIYVLFSAAARIGFGPLAPPPAPDDPIRLLDPPSEPPEDVFRPGYLAGMPIVWALACLLALPLGVYVVSYIPWAMIEGHQLFPGWPAGHTGQTLWDLTLQMYGYHNSLSAAHPASSPWWAWPENLKPVWFYQESLGNGTAASIYDAGSLVIWWIGIPAVAFVSWMAFKRRSLALTLIAVGFAAQWIPWARIDRAAFQYHYYTALPFVVLALAYFMAELWHGASRHVWQLARVAAALAIMGPALLWLLDRPLCAVVGVTSVNPGSAACPAVIPSFVVTARTAALAVVVGVGLLAIIWRFLAFDRRTVDGAGRGSRSAALATFVPLLLIGLVVAGALFAAAALEDVALLTLTNVPVEPIALLALIPLGYLGLQVIAARDARRFVAGFVVAAVGWFAVLYPNISALPLPSAIVNAYQGILPTYLYAFQFPVSTVDRNKPMPIFTTNLVILTIALTVTCVVVAYSAWVWRLTLAESAAEAARGTGSGSGSGTDDGLARTDGG